MKKVIIVLFSSIILIVVGLWIYIAMNNKGEIKPDMIAIKTNYSYISKDNKKGKFVLYYNEESSILSYVNQNSFSIHSKDKSKYYSLDVTDIYISNTFMYNDEYYYAYNIEYTLPKISDLYIPNCYLTVQNTKFEKQIEIGSYEINSIDYPLLPFSYLQGVYRDVNNTETLVGINIKIDLECKLSDIQMGSMIYTSLDKIEKKDYSKNSDEINYEKNYMKVDSSYNILGELIFIPVFYKKDNYTSRCHMIFETEDETYLLDEFLYQTSVLDPNSYKTYVTSWTDSYA